METKAILLGVELAMKMANILFILECYSSIIVNQFTSQAHNFSSLGNLASTFREKVSNFPLGVCLRFIDHIMM